MAFIFSLHLRICVLLIVDLESGSSEILKIEMLSNGEDIHWLSLQFERLNPLRFYLNLFFRKPA